MTELGVDINGLLDGAERDGRLVPGSIPSVVVLPAKRGRGPLTVVAGTEAGLAIEGRGWEWPPSAACTQTAGRLRIPVAEALDALVRNSKVPTAHGEMDAEELVAAAVAALVPDGSDQEPVVVIPDNGRFDEEVQQRLLDALGSRGLRPRLIWRSVAAVLGVEDVLNKNAHRLYGKSIGVVSVLADGIDVSLLRLEKPEDGRNDYVVPMRDSYGMHVPFARSLIRCAEDGAAEILADDPDRGWQLVWGNGAALERMLGTAARPRLIQTQGRWRLLEIDDPAASPLPGPDAAGMALLRDILRRADHVIVEGPAAEARETGQLLLGHRIAETLALSGRILHRGRPHEFTAAKGASAFARRSAAGQTTYYDFLPQIRICVRNAEGDPVFVDALPNDQRVEGGQAFRTKPPLDLGLIVREGKDALDFYISLERSGQTRKASIVLPRPSAADTRVFLDIEQYPLRGLARISVVPEEGADMAPITLDWSRMAVDGRLEAEIVRDLAETGPTVPPTVPVEGHWLRWNERIGGRSLRDILRDFPERLDEDTLSGANDLALQLSRRSSPMRMTAGRDRDKGLYRALSTDGQLPEKGTALADAGPMIDRVLALLATGIEKKSPLRGAALKACSWSFSRCPVQVIRHLAELAAHGKVVAHLLDYRAMGRVFTKEEDIRLLFSLCCRLPRLMQYHMESLLTVISIRPDAASLLELRQAERLLSGTLERLSEYHGHSGPGTPRLARTCIRLVAALLRHRVRSPRFLMPESDPQGWEVRTALVRVEEMLLTDQGTRDLARGAVEWLENRGVDSGILDQEDED